MRHIFIIENSQLIVRVPCSTQILYLHTSNVYNINVAYEDFGKKLKSAREKRGWDQQSLANAAEATQQTVSRWESGASRPREDVVRKLAELLEADPDDWLKYAGYQISKPVRPVVQLLPLDKLTPENFEFFCRDLVQKLNPKASVHRYGQQGHKQYGIDLFAKEKSNKLDYQCKRHEQFGPEDVRQAVKDTTMEAEHHHLLLSRQATTGARDAIDEYDDWSLWDAEDISAKVRYLPKQDALDLVDTYFPGWRQHFLGIDKPTVWLSSEKYFLPFNNRLKIFSHGWDLFGRHSELKSLTDFMEQTNDRAIILSGRGGVGKTRLLKALSDRLVPETKVLFMAQRADPTPADFENLPQQGLLIIDDAHEYGDLLSILSGIAATRPYLKVLISTRPYGIALLEDQLLRAGLNFTHEDIVQLGNMTQADAEKLAAEVLNENNGDNQYARRIAEITLDCPLATVVGARLVANGKIRPEILANSTDFRMHLLRSFRDVITGQIGGTKNADEVKDLLDLIAVIQPVETTDSLFEEVVTEVIKRPYDKVLRDMRALEDAGVLLRRKNRLRIAPDLLADFIRADAAYDPAAGQPTRYIERVFKATRNDLATNLLVNLSQLDWRLSVEGTQAALLDPIWDDLKKQFLDGDITTRQAMLSALEKVAYYQPSQAIMFARLAIDNPTNKAKKTDHDHWLGKPTYARVLAETAPILKYAAYTIEYMPEALDLLKQLAEQDKRQQNQYPDHPMRALQELAAIQPGKPLGYIEAVIDHVREWLNEDYNADFSPFDILEAVLATEGHKSEMKGIQLTLQPFKVRADVISKVREKVIDDAFAMVKTGTLQQAVRAMHAIEEALRGPFGQDMTPEDRENWEPGQLAVLKRLKGLAKDTSLDPFIAVEVRRAVNWHATYSKTDTKPAALAVLKAIPDTIDYQLARGIADGWGWTFERTAATYERDEATFNEWLRKLSQQLIIDHADDFDSLIAKLETRIGVFNSLDTPGSGDVGRFMFSLAHESAAFSEQLIRYIIANPQSELTLSIGVTINALARLNYDQAVALALEAHSKGNVEIDRRLAHSLGWALNDIPVTPAEMPLIEDLVDSSDKFVRQSIVRVVKRFSDDQHLQALDLLMRIEFADDKHLAGEVLGEFNPEHGAFKVVELTPAHLDRIHDQLLQIDSIDDHNIGGFIEELSFYHPDQVLRLLFNRVESKHNRVESFGYSPVPYAWEHKAGLRFSETADYERILQRVRAWTTEQPNNWYRYHYGPQIFRAVSAGSDKVTLRVITEWAMSTDAEQIKAAANLFSEFPAWVLWRNTALVDELLERAQKFGDDCYRSVSSSLHGMAIHGGRTGTPGQPFQEDIDQRDRAAKMMRELPPTSPAYKFYKSLHKMAIDNIKRDTIDEEDLFDD